jgi:hypothetical protein
MNTPFICLQSSVAATPQGNLWPQRQRMIEPAGVDGIRDISRALVEEPLTGHQITTRLHASNTPTPTGNNQVWHAATGKTILPPRVYADQGRDYSRPPGLPKSRTTDAYQLCSLKTGRSDRAEHAWGGRDAPPIIPVPMFDQAQRPLRRNSGAARTMYQPASCRDLRRTLVKGGECGLGRVCFRLVSVCKKYADCYDAGKGPCPLTVGRMTMCDATRVRANRLDAGVWQARGRLSRHSSVIPPQHQTWAEAKQPHLSALEAQHLPLFPRRQRLAHQDPRLLDADRAEIIHLRALHTWRQYLFAALPQRVPDNNVPQNLAQRIS